MTQPKHLLSIEDLGLDGIREIMRLSDSFADLANRPIPKVPALRGKVVANVFYENSTRTRLSFESAIKRLSADVMTFVVANSSVNKGESLKDTANTLLELGADALIVRHSSAGVPMQIASWVDVPVINAGDGCHEHPTQALLDCYSISKLHKKLRRKSKNSAISFNGLVVGIVGDILHSRVARSLVTALNLLGAEVVLAAPRTMLPPAFESWDVVVSNDFDSLLGKLDIVYLLRIQSERMKVVSIPSLREYTTWYGLSMKRVKMLQKDALIMHPGPMNQGVEITPEVAQLPNCIVGEQVANGVITRMAVLFRLLVP
ncbi:MAG: aspartate carbamoyltransferase catalytic subunit [Actinobacteria bacterium]|nr:aspartate carbamoyltransferase catalytic subunit [Actinomycetota bacterium]MCL6104130.1 aspartate carbamoyltransferase catalytic subunit [Actinomycetota bacterium]